MDFFPWSWSILTRQPWWMCSYALSAVWSHRLYDWRHLLYETNRPTFRISHKSDFFFFNYYYFCLVVKQYFSQQWLNEQKLAQRLIELIHPERDEEVVENFIIFKFNKYFILVFKSVPLLLFTTKPFIRLSVQMWLLFVWFLPNTEAVKCIADFVWYHSSEQRPGQPAPRDFTAWPTADCAWIVSWKDSHARSLCSLNRMQRY